MCVCVRVCVRVCVSVRGCVRVRVRVRVCVRVLFFFHPSQLCINFANEKLQKLFNDQVFEGEKNTYRDDGIDVDALNVSYTSNAPCVKVGG